MKTEIGARAFLGGKPRLTSFEPQIAIEGKIHRGRRAHYWGAALVRTPRIYQPLPSTEQSARLH